MDASQMISPAGNIERSLFSQDREKSFIDKVLGKEDITAQRNLIKKDRLKREELLEILNLICGSEAKLLNYSEWDRYIILKFFVWIREFVKIYELLYDYRDDLYKKGNTCIKCDKLISSTNLNKCTCIQPIPLFTISPRINKLLENCERLIEHNAKFLIDLYLNIGRTSLSVGATGFLDLLKNKFEIYYPGLNQQKQEPQQNTIMFKK